jgi:heme exporter protein C
MERATTLKRSDPWVRLWLGAGFLTLLAGFYFALSAPPDANQGWLVRIMYIHVPTAWVGYLAFFGCLYYSVAYVIRRKEHYDRMAAVSAELGLIFLGLAIFTGSLWGRPTWGVYWTWDPRLTTTAILFVVYVGYFVLRAAIEDPELRAKAAAGVGILGSINVPISYMSVVWWRSLHQIQSINLMTGRVTIAPPMLLALMVNLAAFSLLFIGIARLRGQIALREALLEEEP